MITEILGANFVNKGAELMLPSAKEVVHGWAEGNVAAAHMRVGSLRQRSRAGIGHVVRLDSTKLDGFRPFVNVLAGTIPRRLRSRLMLFTEADVDVVLDASGFTYSDQWGPQSAEQMARRLVRWRTAGKRVVLLPQAFGPFEGVRIRKAMTYVLDHVDLVFPRDEVSMGYVLDIATRTDHVHLAPDFTNLLSPPLDERLAGKAVIVPNQRMIDKGAVRSEHDYIDFMRLCMEEISAHGLESAILVHEMRDYHLANRLASACSPQAPIMVSTDPLELKGLLVGAHLVVASRFHALVGALSESTPCVGTGWSHKYNALFQDYKCEACLLGPSDPKERIAEVFNDVLDPDRLRTLKSHLNKASSVQRDRTKRMWALVREAVT